MFYPALKRRENYDKKKDGSYYRYSYYRFSIIEDCQKRCVYCDLLLKEHAFEGMHLDHFRPQSLFDELINDPNNLVLSCPKCNSLKTNHWPCTKVTVNSPSHNNIVGFIDPFSENMNDYFSVDKDGVLHAIKKPADYLIELLKLNRNSKILLRKRRLQLSIAAKLKKLLDKQLDGLFNELSIEGCNKIKLMEKYKRLKKSNEILNEILLQQ